MAGIKIIYVAGYSRSGSTILDLLLSNDSRVFGTGELCYLYDDSLNKDRSCTCGNIYTKCDFWSDYINTIDIERVREVVRQVESRKSFNRLIDDRLDKSLILEYAKYQEALFEYIAERSGNMVIVDSSKSTKDMAGRCFALNKYTSLDVRMVHLLKNGKSTTQSYLTKGRNWALEGHVQNNFLQGARSIIGWKLANSIAAKAENIMKDRYYRLKYEDIVLDPASKLHELGDFLDLEMSDLIKSVEDKESLRPGHHVGGNRLRLSKNIIFKVGKTKPSKLDIFHNIIFSVLAGSLSKKFGYKII